MKEKWHHYALGNFIAEQLKRAKVNIRTMCKEIGMGIDTYEKLKRATIRI